MTSALHNLSSDIVAHGIYSPYDVVFSVYYTPDVNLIDGLELSSWFPTSIETKKALMTAIDDTVPERLRKLFDLYFGLWDGKYYTLQELAQVLNQEVVDVTMNLCEIATAFSLSDRTPVYKTLSSDVYGDILRAYEVERRNLWEIPV